MITAVSYIKPVGRGVTTPHLFIADDGEAYVVKFQTNSIGPKVLVNELLAARLGELWGLCFPPGGMINLGKEVLAQNPNLARHVPAGMHFGCRFLRNCRYINLPLLKKAVNKQEMAGVMLFDHLFHNVDRTRNPRNLLIRKEDPGWKIYAIDHSHLFYRGKWNETSLDLLLNRITINSQRTYGVLLKHYLQADDFVPYFDRVNATSDDVMQALVNEIPQEWLPGASERDVLANWLCRRRALAEDIVERLCSVIPHRE